MVVVACRLLNVVAVGVVWEGMVDVVLFRPAYCGRLI